MKKEEAQNRNRKKDSPSSGLGATDPQNRSSVVLPLKICAGNSINADKPLKVSSLKEHSQFGDTDVQEVQYLEGTLKAKVYAWLRIHLHEPRYGKIKKLAAFLGVDYERKKLTLFQISSDFKTDVRSGLPPNCPSSQHNWRAVGYVPSCLDRKKFAEVERDAVSDGWRLSSNKNRELIWENDPSLGRIRWWTTGQVHILVKKPHNLGRAKQLVSKAFYGSGLIKDDKIAFEFLDSLHWYGSDDVWRTPDGRKLPYMKITAYREIFGDIVLGDLSHRDAVELKVCPQLIERMSLLQQQTTQILQMALTTLQQEGKDRQQLGEIIKQSTEQTKAFSELMKDLSAPRSRPSQDRSVV